MTPYEGKQNDIEAGSGNVDFSANETMKRLAKCRFICKGSPEGNEIEDLLKGLGYEQNDHKLKNDVYAYNLGRSRKSGKGGKKS